MTENDALQSSQLLDILLVEDNPGDVKLTELQMKRQNVHFNLYSVLNGEDAIRLLNKEEEFSSAPTPDLIFLDINLPQISGHEVANYIRTHPTFRNIPFYMLSSSQHPADTVDAQKNGASCYFTKPLDFTKLRSIIGISSRIRYEEVDGHIYYYKSLGPRRNAPKLD
ncbi:MAG: response regulator [Alphaproteobacteria bacterium]